MGKMKTDDKATLKGKPTSVTANMYNVGFGDCFLLKFSYPGNVDRNVLIDCGSKSAGLPMSRVVEEVAKDCGEKLHAVVVTHRHSDHLSAFGDKSTGDRLTNLHPEVVIQPWTEHPDAAANAEEAPNVYSPSALTSLAQLDYAQRFAWQVNEDPQTLLAGVSGRRCNDLATLAQSNVNNPAAVLCLQKMVPKDKHFYVYAGSPSGLGNILPGVRVSVLGPPTLEQHDAIKTDTPETHPDYWKFYSGLGAAGADFSARPGRARLFPGAATLNPARAPSVIRWVIAKLQTANYHNVLRIVTVLNSYLNNTSVILLFEVGNTMLLFPGDAQCENWDYSKANKTLVTRLKETALYKVGHHGSANATPIWLWKGFRHRNKTKGRLITFLSTKRTSEYPTVPATTLNEALGNETDLHSSLKLGKLPKDSYTFNL